MGTKRSEGEGRWRAASGPLCKQVCICMGMSMGRLCGSVYTCMN